MIAREQHDRLDLVVQFVDFFLLQLAGDFQRINQIRFLDRAVVFPDREARIFTNGVDARDPLSSSSKF